MDKSAWKTEDKAWMKERRAGWKEVKKTLDGLISVRSKDKKFLKEFYMTGNVSAEDMTKVYGRRAVKEGKPLNPMEAPVLLECWLSADQSDECWESIKNKYVYRELNDSCRRLLETLDHYPDEEALFGGLEERLYYFLCPTRCRAEDFPEMSRRQYIDYAWGIYGDIRNALTTYFESEKHNPNNFIRFRLPEWQDSMESALLKRPRIIDYLYRVVLPAKNILSNSSKHSDIAIEVAAKVLEILKDESTPQSMREKVEELLASKRSK